jgi:hypothetical protein
MSWSICYKGYFIVGNAGEYSPVVAMQSKTGIGYEWRVVCKSFRAAQIAITKHIRCTENIKEQQK